MIYENLRIIKSPATARLVQEVLEYLHWKTKKELGNCVRNDKYIWY